MIKHIFSKKKAILSTYENGDGRIPTRMRRFGSNRSGSVSIEFVLVIPFFFMFLYLLIDTAIIFFATTQLDSGLESARRMVSTGGIQQIDAPFREKTFRTELCKNVFAAVNCNNVKLDIRAFRNFTSVKMAEPVLNNALNTKAFSLNFGKACETVIIRAYYEMTSLAGILRSDVQALSPLKNFITASVAFRNEEYASC